MSFQTITAHQNAVLALATNGKSVFAAGVDYRIQVICGNTSKDVFLFFAFYF